MCKVTCPDVFGRENADQSYIYLYCIYCILKLGCLNYGHFNRSYARINYLDSQNIGRKAWKTQLLYLFIHVIFRAWIRSFEGWSLAPVISVSGSSQEPGVWSSPGSDASTGSFYALWPSPSVVHGLQWFFFFLNWSNICFDIRRLKLPRVIVAFFILCHDEDNYNSHHGLMGLMLWLIAT